MTGVPPPRRPRVPVRTIWPLVIAVADLVGIVSRVLLCGVLVLLGLGLIAAAVDVSTWVAERWFGG